VKPQHLTLVALLLLVAGLASVVCEGLHSSTSANQITCCKGSCYPDPGNDGGPCGSNCFSACCTCNSTIGMFAGVQPSIETPQSDELDALWPEHVNPQEIFYDIFHPPRA
jgi:hypothetical protein